MKIIEELRKMKETEGRFDFLIPNYLYVEKYGRIIEEDIQKIAECLGYSEWLMYYCSSLSKDKGLVIDFMNEVQKKEKLGREFSGLVCIKITDAISQTELEEFLQLISRYKERYTFMFSVNHLSNVAMIEKELKQHFYIRKNEATLFSPSEMKELLKDFFDEHQVKIGEKELENMTTNLVSREWDEEDQIKNLIIGTIMNYLINQYISGEEEVDRFEIINVEDCLHNLTEASQKTKIGFILE